MKRLYLDTRYGLRDARDVWRGCIDEYVEGIIKEIEGGKGVTFEDISRIYRHFYCIEEVDERFVLLGATSDEVVVEWPDFEWVIKFKLK